MVGEKMIGLMDCNNFFVSCERLFRPDLAHKPVAVLSSNDGCIVSRSQEVKDLGVPMGIPYFKVKDISAKEGITIFSSNFTLYRDISRRVMEVLKDEVTSIEIYSIDEAFFELPQGITEDEVAVVRRSIIQKVGIPVSIGVAPTKTIAKYAGTLAKKQKGARVLSLEDWLVETPSVGCGSVWGIGRQTTAKLRSFGILTVKDLLDIDMSFIRSKFGVEGERLRLELSGIHAEGRASSDSSQKSIMSTGSFKSEIRDLGGVEGAVAHHVISVAAKLREQGNLASRMSVTIRTNRFGDEITRGGTEDVEFSAPTSNTQTMLKEALALTRALFVPGVAYKKAGVVVSGIMPEEYQSESLFSEDTMGEITEIDTLTDALNKRFGHGMIQPAISFHNKKWSSRSDLYSQEYTTKWNDIAHVKAV